MRLGAQADALLKTYVLIAGTWLDERSRLSN
jgi:hypothetical protein